MLKIPAALPDSIRFIADIRFVGDGGSMEILLSSAELGQESTISGSGVIVCLFNRALNHSFQHASLLGLLVAHGIV